jgi:hypothetical protein
LSVRTFCAAGKILPEALGIGQFGATGASAIANRPLLVSPYLAVIKTMLQSIRSGII